MLNNDGQCVQFFEQLELIDDEFFGGFLQLVSLVKIGHYEAADSIFPGQRFDELVLTLLDKRMDLILVRQSQQVGCQIVIFDVVRVGKLDESLKGSRFDIFDDGTSGFGFLPVLIVEHSSEDGGSSRKEKSVDRELFFTTDLKSIRLLRLLGV